MDLEYIRKMSENRSGGLKKLATDIGMSEQNLHRCIRNNKIQAADLERIALLLKVDIRVFFDEEVSTPANNTATADNGSIAFAGNNNHGNIGCKSDEILQERIKHLEELLTEKERLIKVYEKMMEERK